MEEDEIKNEKNEKRIKNLVSVIILLAGLFVGSLFVDISQVVRGGGFSLKNLSKTDIFTAGGKTWVAYTEAPVVATVINDDTCGDKCDTTEALVRLRSVLPTLSTEKVDFNSDKGKQLIEKFGIKTLPAYVFDGGLSKTDFYTQANMFFEQKDDQYMLKAQEAGMPVGKYLETPKVNENDATFGQADSKVKVVIFSDFQCPYCKVFFSSLRDTMKNYGDKVFFVYKHLPLDIHPQASNAALASECAQDQGKFWEYADKLYASQSDWGAAKDTTKFKAYAQALGLKTTDFNQCLDSKKFQDRIDASKSEAADFGIAGTPAVFVNDQFSAGAVSAEDLKKSIDDQLNK
jgi:protein-disulfide isomerase